MIGQAIQKLHHPHVFAYVSFGDFVNDGNFGFARWNIIGKLNIETVTGGYFGFDTIRRGRRELEKLFDLVLAMVAIGLFSITVAFRSSDLQNQLVHRQP
jgi:hypothetical protein